MSEKGEKKWVPWFLLKPTPV